MILNGNITAISSSYGAGIGSGMGGYTSTSTVLNLTILNGNITARSSDRGAGIGAGYGTSQRLSRVGILSILDGTITANGPLASIGSSGEGSEVQLLRFSGNAMLICNTDATKYPVNASSIVFSNASLVFATSGNRLFGVSPSSSALFDLAIVYESVTVQNNEPFSKLNATFLQIGNLTIPRSSHWTFCVSGMGHNDCFLTRSSIVKSLVMRVPSAGNYLVKAFNDVTSGFLETSEGISILSVSSNRSFISECHFVADATSTVSPTTPRTVSSSPSPTAQFSASGRDEQTDRVADSTAFRGTIAPLRLRNRPKR
jgi:hypothetical protein